MQDSSTEEWRVCERYPDYEVSNKGNVRSWRPNTSAKERPPVPKTMTPYKNMHGYITAHLRNDVKHGPVPIHILVCEAWHGARPNRQAQVRHLDGNKENNTLENLCWGTPKQNAQDRLVHGNQDWGESINTNKLTKEQVLAVLDSPLSATELGKQYGVCKSTICRIRKGITWTRLTKEQKERLEQMK